MKDCMYKQVKAPHDEEGDDGVKVQIKTFYLSQFIIIHSLGSDRDDDEKDGPRQGWASIFL